MEKLKDDNYFMGLALKEAQKAAIIDEVPVGAIIVFNGVVISSAHNLKEKHNCATRHAEIIAIEKAAKKLSNWWLEDCIMYVTLEPCAMCAGALINSRLKQVVIGTADAKSGCCGSLYNLVSDTRFNHTLDVKIGVLAADCSAILTSFFKKKRGK